MEEGVKLKCIFKLSVSGVWVVFFLRTPFWGWVVLFLSNLHHSRHTRYRDILGTQYHCFWQLSYYAVQGSCYGLEISAWCDKPHLTAYLPSLDFSQQIHSSQLQLHFLNTLSLHKNGFERGFLLGGACLNSLQISRLKYSIVSEVTGL